MTAAVLVEAAKMLGIALVVTGDKIRCDAPKGALTPQFKAALVEHKADIIALLSRPRAPESSESRVSRDGTPGTYFPPPPIVPPRDASLARDLESWPLDERSAWEERVAIMECDGGLTRVEAERAAFDSCRRSRPSVEPIASMSVLRLGGLTAYIDRDDPHAERL